MAKLILERYLEAEMDDHLGYEKWEQTAEQIDKNSRKWHTPKTLKSTYGELDIHVPRDRNAEFEPQIAKKIPTGYFMIWR